MPQHYRRFRGDPRPAQSFVDSFKRSFEAEQLGRRRQAEKDEERRFRREERATTISDEAILRERRDEAERERDKRLRDEARQEKRDFFRFQETERKKKETDDFKQIKQVQEVLTGLEAEDSFSPTPELKTAISNWKQRLRDLQGVPKPPPLPSNLATGDIVGEFSQFPQQEEGAVPQVIPEQVAPDVVPPVEGAEIRVIHKPSGQTGTIPENEFDPAIYERL